ncbi:MAG: hypothetical protein ACREL4_01095, partial [Gemmatimonadales bacterium]
RRPSPSARVTPMSLNKRIYAVLALSALTFAVGACADSTAPTSSANKSATSQHDGSAPCEQQGSTIKMC